MLNRVFRKSLECTCVSFVEKLERIFYDSTFILLQF